MHEHVGGPKEGAGLELVELSSLPTFRRTCSVPPLKAPSPNTFTHECSYPRSAITYVTIITSLWDSAKMRILESETPCHPPNETPPLGGRKRLPLRGLRRLCLVRSLPWRARLRGGRHSRNLDGCQLGLCQVVGIRWHSAGHLWRMFHLGGFRV